MVAKECLPPLGGVFYALPIFGDRDLLDAELEEFAMDPGSAPRNNPMTVHQISLRMSPRCEKMRVRQAGTMQRKRRTVRQIKTRRPAVGRSAMTVARDQLSKADMMMIATIKRPCRCSRKSAI